MARLDEESPDPPDLLSRLKPQRALICSTFLILSACSDKVANLLDNDNGENFNLEMISAQVTVPKVPYSDLEAVTKTPVDEDSFGGYGVGVFIDNKTKGGLKFDKDEKRINVTKKFWCDTALQAVNVYNHFELRNDNCIQDSPHCDPVDCSEAALAETARRLYEEEKEEDEEEEGEDSGGKDEVVSA